MLKLFAGSSKRRQTRGLLSTDNLKMFGAACVLVFLFGNMAMLQSYHTLTSSSADDARVERLKESAVFPHYSNHLDSSRGSRDEYAQQSPNFLDNRELFARFAADFLPVDKGNIFGSHENQYSILEARARRLMEDVNARERINKWAVSSGKVKKVQNKNSLYFKDRESLRAGSTLKKTVDESILDKDLLNCDDVANIQDLKYVGGGWTKSVYRGVHNGHEVAVKTVDLQGHDIGHCKENGGNMTQCYAKAARKIVKEIILLQALAHENVIKVLGFCVPTRPFEDSNDAAGGDEEAVDNTVAMVTELGDPVDQIKLLQMSWEDRLRVSYDVIKLIAFLAQTQYGSVALNDFRRTQFVLVNGTLKLSDVDDAGFGEPDCRAHEDCSFKPGDGNISKVMKCSMGRCSDHNELHNIYKTGQQFSTFLLPHGAPPLLRPFIDRIVQHYEHLTAKADTLLGEVGNVVAMYRSGAYLGDSLKHRGPTKYEAHLHSHYPGLYDYRCRFSISGGACTVSVFDVKEAEEYCDMDEECRGFVFTRKRTWTGRTIIHLKNGRGLPSPNADTDLYLKPA